MQRCVVLACLLTAGSFLSGCSSRSEVDRDSPSANATNEATRDREVAAPVTPEAEVFVFRAKYHQTTGPCIPIGDALGMPIIDAFQVVEVLNGDLGAKSIHVRAMTEGGSAYPKEMATGKIYTLRLTPSDATAEQLREFRNEGVTTVWINGDEIEEQKAAK